MPTTPKCRERLSWRHLPNPMRKRAHVEALPIFVWAGGPSGGAADQASLVSESNRRATQGTGKPAADFPPWGHQFEKEAKAHGVLTRGCQIYKEAGAHDVRGSGVESDKDSAPFEWVVAADHKAM
jgi:hypothetical protein